MTMLNLRSRRPTTASRRRLTYISPAAVLLLSGVSGSDVVSAQAVDWSKFANDRNDERITQEQQEEVEDTSGEAMLTAATGSKSENTSSLRQGRSLAVNTNSTSALALASPTPPVAALSTPPRTYLQLKYVGNDLGYPLNECEGDCDDDIDCTGDLICVQRETASYKPVPGCLGGEANSGGTDYCARPNAAIVTANPTTAPPTISPAPTPAYPRVKKIGNNWNPAAGFPLNECEGDCDRNSDCKGNLICFEREGGELVPGCLGGEEGSSTDYCIRPDATIVTARPTTAPPTLSPVPTLNPTTSRPTPIPTPLPTPIPTPIPTRNPSGLLDYSKPGRDSNLGECEGDCDRNVSIGGLQIYAHDILYSFKVLTFVLFIQIIEFIERLCCKCHQFIKYFFRFVYIACSNLYIHLHLVHLTHRVI